MGASFGPGIADLMLTGFLAGRYPQAGEWFHAPEVDLDSGRNPG